MTALRYLARLFIDTFGITNPPPDGRDRAARYIAILLIMLFSLLCGLIAVAAHVFNG